MNAVLFILLIVPSLFMLALSLWFSAGCWNVDMLELHSPLANSSGSSPGANSPSSS